MQKVKNELVGTLWTLNLCLPKVFILLTANVITIDLKFLPTTS